MVGLRVSSGGPSERLGSLFLASRGESQGVLPCRGGKAPARQTPCEAVLDHLSADGRYVYV